MTRLLLATSLLLTAACASDARWTRHELLGERPAPKVLPQDVVRMDFSPAPTTTTTHYHPPTTTTAVPVTAPPTTQVVERSGDCGGWEGLVAAYFPADQVATGCRILLCESNGNPNAVSPTNDHGLWQINAVHRNSFDWSRRYDPHVNTQFARKLWGEQGWSPWSCY